MRAKQLAAIAREKEQIRLKLVVTASKLAATARELKKSYTVLDQRIGELENAKIAARNVLEDLSSEKAKLEASEKDLRKFKLAVDNTSDQIIITDAEATVLYINSATEKITGYAAKEAVGQKAGKLWGTLME